ncbi:nucleotidyl transferase AbiEii/AbiGii toxin family protein [Roseovarius pacificus]|uniref:nucleotidyl transferase AbiEii/AbiGii toxin family protein n=1 Tax=Roseovarius pacificus TaxID=337701 RepID=UPI002A189BCA|nr:nucleotidyl transferase AbiEii/AbiGii toxin family protein [Roseovarius pacificus]
MSEPFLSLSSADRKEALAVAADRSGRPAHLLEKDVWVVWALQTLFSSELGEHLVFKGGTSLSKAYGVIQRFSEDVDLTYDIRAIAPDLVGERAEALPTTRSEEKRWLKAVRDRLPKWVVETTQPLIQDAIAAQGLSATTRADGDKLFIDDEAAAAGSGHVARGVKLEFDARSTSNPVRKLHRRSCPHKLVTNQ